MGATEKRLSPGNRVATGLSPDLSCFKSAVFLYIIAYFGLF